MDYKEEFLELYRTYVKRDGADKLLEYLLSPQSDFFTAPASTRFHGSYTGGLVEHSVNVYHCLKDYLSRERVRSVYRMEYTEETVAVAALLHDVCKINCYRPGTRNVKEDGVWKTVDTFEYDDRMPYGFILFPDLCVSAGRRPSLSGIIWAFPARRISATSALPLSSFL